MLRNIGSTWVVTAATIIATYVLMPFVIHRLGEDGYGTWTLITAITGYMSLMALGVPMACVRYLAGDLASGDVRRANVTIGSCAGLYLMLGAIALAVGATLAAAFAAGYDIPRVWRAEAYVAFGLMAIHVAFSFLGLLPEGILFAHHAFVARNLVRLGGVALRLLLTIGLLSLHPSIALLAVVQLACLAVDFALSLVVVRRRFPAIRIHLSDFEWAAVRKVCSFSVYVLLLTAGARLSFETDAIVIAAFLGVGAIPYYVVANSLIVYLMEFIVAIAAVVSPMATTLHAADQVGELRDMFLRWSKIALSISLMAGLFLVVLGPKFIGWWINPEFELRAGEVLQILTLSSLIFLPVRGVALPVLMGVGKPRVPTFAFVGAGLLNLAMSVALVRPLGLVGVAIGTAVPNVLFAAVVLVVACRELHIGVWSFLSYVVPRAAIGAIPAFTVLLWFRVSVGVEGILGLAVAGSAMLVLFAATWVFFVYRDDPLVDLKPHVVRLRAWSRA
jgi:O-antigen/teichoic acid export membrane protein